MSSITTTTQDATLELAVRSQTYVADLVERMQARLADEEGQTAAEYMGILLIVGTIIAAIIKLKLHERIGKAVDGAITSMGG